VCECTGYGSVELKSSSLNNVGCPTYPLAFYCKATGSLNGLFWSLDDSVIHRYTPFDDQKIYFDNETNSYSAIYRNIRGPNIYESELLFISLPQTSAFKIACAFAGTYDSMIVTVMGEMD